ncbi:transmembrane protein 18 [Brachyhypopomus gauderio]|uniref:transmembrane protein 18 n=1 Tax=Brachyhypopomus gauderio TaxID=698409 RepID=UPI00404291DA
MSAQKPKNISAVPIDGFSNVRITSTWTFLQSVKWSEPWLTALIAFHVLCFGFTVLSCKYYRLQIVHFLIMVVMVYCAEYLNEIAAMNWRSFSEFQYFDSKGMFISLVYSVPLLINTLIIVCVWVKRTFSAMAELKIVKLKKRAARDSCKKTQ